MQKEEYQDTRETGPQAREYLLGVGRFMGRDLIKGLADFPFTLNEYGYCWNNPLMLMDRNGAWPEFIENAVEWGKEHKGAVFDGIRVCKISVKYENKLLWKSRCYTTYSRRIIKMMIKKVPYILMAVFLLFENIIVGNFAACKERSISKALLSKKLKKILFPFIMIKKVTYVTLSYQIINYILFTTTLCCILLMKNDFQKVFQVYWNFEKYYIFCAPLFLGGRLYWINLYGLIRKKRCGMDWVPEIFQKLNGEIYKIDDNEVRIVKPADVDGCVFVMLEHINPYITDVFYQDIVRKFLDMNYMLVCINEFPSNDLEKYKTIIEETIRFFHICDKPFFYMGCEVNSIFEILEINSVFKSNGMIWLCELKKKKVMKYLMINLEFYKYEEFIPDEQNVCVLNAYMKDAEKYLENWIEKKILSVN